jgi:PAT family beta-lactamase induction signal transducer AmpG
VFVLDRILRGIAVYKDLRMLGLVGLGYSSGFPFLLKFSTLSFWLLDEGVDIKAVAIFASTGIPYSLKFLWAPFLDRVPIPLLSRIFGLRRSWIIALQLGLMAAIIGVAYTDPRDDLWLTAFAVMVLATVSASQDVVIDAYRVELLEEDEQGAGAAAAVVGYRLGMLVAGAGALYIAAASGSWGMTYLLMAPCLLVGIATTLLMPEPVLNRAVTSATGLAKIARDAVDAVVGPFKDMTSRDGWFLFLLFIMLYSLADRLASTMTNPFLWSIGFEKIEIANIAKTYGLAATLIGTALGGALVRSAGIVKALWVGGFIMMASNLMFCVQALAGHDTWVLIATIGIEKISGGVGSTAAVAYLSALCNKRYTATQYALLSAMAGMLGTALSTTTGWLVEKVGWVEFFALTALAAIPGLALLWILSVRGWTGLPALQDASPASPAD